MSSTYRKIKYVQEGIYGSTEHKTLYMKTNHSSDYTTFYDEDGDIIFGFGEWGIGDELDLGSAITTMLTTRDEKLESCTLEEMNLMNKHKKLL